MDKQIKIALAGNPNCGKTTLFNALTGSNQFVGNWPGVTVEKKEGKLKKHEDVVIMDLPGIYSLSPYTLEEVVARNYLIKERPDAILNIIDGTNLERNLYLTTQLTELGIPVVVAINMMDVVKKNGDSINTQELARELGCKVVAFTMGPPPAEGMLRELMAMGIAPERIYAEEKSFDTRENLLFAADIIRENGLDTHVVIASDNFHQYRGQLFARQAGLEAQSAGCFSPWFLGAGYACREVVGILATWAGIA